jgi:hypothetical protein
VQNVGTDLTNFVNVGTKTNVYAGREDDAEAWPSLFTVIEHEGMTRAYVKKQTKLFQKIKLFIKFQRAKQSSNTVYKAAVSKTECISILLPRFFLDVFASMI